jgi:hypothetical protein
MKTTLEIPDAIFRRAKAKAAGPGERISNYPRLAQGVRL